MNVTLRTMKQSPGNEKLCIELKEGKRKGAGSHFKVSERLGISYPPFPSLLGARADLFVM